MLNQRSEPCSSTTRPSRATSYKARLLLAKLGLEYETVDVDVVDRSGRSELLGR
jgi:glutathione S-transferase